nr:MULTISPECIES: hypothetical protein [unclassified Streptomyces]
MANRQPLVSPYRIQELARSLSWLTTTLPLFSTFAQVLTVKLLCGSSVGAVVVMVDAPLKSATLVSGWPSTVSSTYATPVAVPFWAAGLASGSPASGQCAVGAWVLPR